MRVRRLQSIYCGGFLLKKKKKSQTVERQCVELILLSENTESLVVKSQECDAAALQFTLAELRGGALSPSYTLRAWEEGTCMRVSKASQDVCVSWSQAED